MTGRLYRVRVTAPDFPGFEAVFLSPSAEAAAFRAGRAMPKKGPNPVDCAVTVEDVGFPADVSEKPA